MRSGARSGRLEALTDAVFGFSIALLIVSVQVPADFGGLLETMQGFFGFAPSFSLLILVWYYHYRFFRRFPLEDTVTILLNSVLLFVVLFYVYPLKYVFGVLTQMMSGTFPLSFADVALLMAIYSAGFAAVFGVFSLMYLHAYRKRAVLRLTSDEALSALEHVGDCVIMAAIGVIATIVAQLLPSTWAGPAAGMCYFLIGPAQYLNSRHFEKRRRRMPDALATATVHD